jgi:DNA ligase-1
MSKPFRPMLACEVDLEKVRYPVIVSPKLDGVRAVVRDGVVYSRSNKPIPNKWVQELFGQPEYEGSDGELIVGKPTAPDVYRQTVSGVMSAEGHPNVYFLVFDSIRNPEWRYTERMAAFVSRGPQVCHLPWTYADGPEQVREIEAQLLGMGYEGVILRNPDAPYKNGRGTMKDQCLMKLKSFLDDEAEVIGFEERMHNANDATTNELGLTKRSSHQENKVGRGDLGALVVRWKDMEFNIGTGFDDAQRAMIWADRSAYIGKLVKFKYFPVGVKDKPRHPVFLGWRDPIDL